MRPRPVSIRDPRHGFPGDRRPGVHDGTSGGRTCRGKGRCLPGRWRPCAGIPDGSSYPRGEGGGMDRIERVDRVLRGEAVDRPPLSLWYHFGVQHAGGERLASLALEVFRHYGFDLLKVMNDYFYPMPEGIEAVRSASDLRRVVRFDVERSPWREQLAALGILSDELGGEGYFLDTVFDPRQTLRGSPPG